VRPDLRLARSVALALLLAVSLGAKLVLGNVPGRHDADAAAKRHITEILQRHGYVVAEDDDPASPFVAAERGACEVLVAGIAPQGWHRDILRRLAREGDQVAFLVNGELLPEQPVWQTFSAYYWARLKRFIGLETPGAPPYGLIMSPPCSLEQPAWAELSPRR